MDSSVLDKKLVYEWTIDKAFRVELFRLEGGQTQRNKRIMKRCLAKHVRLEDQIEFLNQLKLGNDAICKFQDPLIENDYFHLISLHQGVRLDKAIKEWIAAKEPAQESNELIVFAQLISCVRYLHKNLILHSFINTKNIYLKSMTSLEIELGGMFFLEKLESKDKHSAHERDKPLYKCPETNIGLAYDIWCLGWVFYELCAHGSAQSYLESIENFNVWTAPAVSPKRELQNVFEKCVNRDEALRLSAQALSDLPAVMQGLQLTGLESFLRSTMKFVNGMIGKVIKSKSHEGAEYQVVELLASGTYNFVFVTLDLQKQQKRALKISNAFEGQPEQKPEDEYILEDIKHPNIIKFYEYFTFEAYKVCITEFYPEGDLRKYLTELEAEGKMIGECELIDYSYQLLKGLRYLHSIKIIHRDINPSNILMADERKTLKIGDFGVAKQANHTMHLFQTACGSFGYEAPDFSLNETYTNKIDVWSLGCVILEMATLKPTFEFQSRTNIVRYFMKDFKQPMLQDGQHVLQPILDKMFVVDPKKRASSEALFKEIRGIKEGQTSHNLSAEQPVAKPKASDQANSSKD